MAVAQGLMLAGTAVSAVGSIKAGKGSKAAADYNASIMERNAKVAEKEAEQIGRIAGFQALEQEEQFKQLTDKIQMGYGKNGWMAATGTPLKRQMRNIIQFQQDMEIAKYNTKVKQNEKMEVATNMKLSAALKRYEGRAQLKAARTKAFGTLLSGAGKIYSMQT
jgi:hypothetical protein|tara:strand:- start:6610 stop:7101 length:492 start_codon:yes stop_codon:yes gene_type:complete